MNDERGTRNDPEARSFAANLIFGRPGVKPEESQAEDYTVKAVADGKFIDLPTDKQGIKQGLEQIKSTGARLVTVIVSRRFYEASTSNGDIERVPAGFEVMFGSMPFAVDDRAPYDMVYYFGKPDPVPAVHRVPAAIYNEVSMDSGIQITYSGVTPEIQAAVDLLKELKSGSGVSLVYENASAPVIYRQMWCAGSVWLVGDSIHDEILVQTTDLAEAVRVLKEGL